MAKNDWYEFEGVIEAWSAKSYLFRGDFWDNAEWVPKSQIKVVEMDENVVPKRAVIEIAGWLCEKNGWV